MSIFAKMLMLYNRTSGDQIHQIPSQVVAICPYYRIRVKILKYPRYPG